MTSRSLVTGGAGFVGSHLVDRLLARGDHVTVLDDFSTGERGNLAEAEGSNRLRVVEGSILDDIALADAMAGCQRVFHLAVQCVRRSLGSPLANHEINATGTLRVLEAARRLNVRRFVYCSSSEVYGRSGDDRLNEDDSRCAPTTVYGAAKLAGEHYALAYYQTYGLPTIIARPFNAYGPREHHRGDLAEVIPRFVIRVLNGLPPIIFGTGENGRDFTYVTETAEGLARAGEAESLIGRRVNLAYGKMITVAQLAALIARLAGRPDLVPIFRDPRPGDILSLKADTTVARQTLDFMARIGIEEGLRRYLEWFRTRFPNPASLLSEEVCNWKMPAT